MKYLKRIFLISVTLFIAPFLLNLNSSAVQAAPEGPGFDIMNKTNKSIWVTFVVAGELVETKWIRPETRLSKDIDSKKDLILGIYDSQPKEAVSLGIMSKLAGKVEITPKPDYVYGFASSAHGKTKYLTWNPAKHKTPAKSLYPQTGTFLGWSGKSEAGYSLKNNVSQDQISLKTSTK